MTNKIRRIFVEKKEGFNHTSIKIMEDLRTYCHISTLQKVRTIIRYDVQGVDDATFEKAVSTVFSEPPVDIVYHEKLTLSENEHCIAQHYLPGQYDQRADSAMQCIQMIAPQHSCIIHTAILYVLEGDINRDQMIQAEKYIINPVDSELAPLEKPETLLRSFDEPKPIAILEGFCSHSKDQLRSLHEELGLAMNLEDLVHTQNYFISEQRDPTITEIRLIDTYWSDHCRHTTFLSPIENVSIDSSSNSKSIENAYQTYKSVRQKLYGENPKKPETLMDIATIGAKLLKSQGVVTDIEESDEINACSIEVNADVMGAQEPWLVMFKNETHNHPTEIEPFGGAATCLGGAIRDPLSGRSYVYQSMRITGSADPRTELSETLHGKLPQRKITTEAAAGFSSYGNQIGLATGLVHEIYHPNYVAKRMEIGAVVGAAPKSWVRREAPQPNDVIILVGGKTGRDGCGGATGSSKAHTIDSIQTCGAEVQKGNAPEERKLQRLFRNEHVSRLIKKCNDFGAGGVSVAIGELADGLRIFLDAVPKKYEGLDATELAVSESQERMAVVVAPENVDTFIRFAEVENLQATIVACVSDDRRIQMIWQNETVVDLSRDFLNTNGVLKSVNVHVRSPSTTNPLIQKNSIAPTDIPSLLCSTLSKLNNCSQIGLGQRFDSTVGSGSVLLPFGGKYQLTPSQSMVALLPVLHHTTTTCSIMSYGFDPYLSSWSPFHGAQYAIVSAVSKIVATGGQLAHIRLSLQEYFERLKNDPSRWGKPFAALLGALHAQLELKIPAIGGKDSMSGSFENIDVPPTLVAFALACADSRNIISTEFKYTGSDVVFIAIPKTRDNEINYTELVHIYNSVNYAIENDKFVSAAVVESDGIATILAQMTFGNRIGFSLSPAFDYNKLFSNNCGAIIAELAPNVTKEEILLNIKGEFLGKTQKEQVLCGANFSLDIQKALDAWVEPLEEVFPTRTNEDTSREIPPVNYYTRNSKVPVHKVAPRVHIPVFPGTNCEYDAETAFLNAGAAVDMVVVRNLKPEHIHQTVTRIVASIDNSNIIMFPGGFSAGDEPDGSGKFIAALFRNSEIIDAVHRLLYERDGLILGICNGFQALIKLGLLPFGEIKPMEETSATLTFNTIGRHVSCMVNTRVSSILSPWLSGMHVGDIHTVAISHGEGRFVASDELLATLMNNGQIAMQYVDEWNKPTMHYPENPNGSIYAIEAITSPDGRILGKMAHSERYNPFTAKNISGNKFQDIFTAGVRYFS